MTIAAADRPTRWGVVLLGLAAGIVGMFQIAKMSIALVEVRAEIGLSLVAASWATTAVSLTGVLFGVMAGRVTAEFGTVRTLVFALLISAVAAFATAFLTDPVAFMASRILEGVGYLLVCAAAPAMMAAVAAPKDRGLALALWGAFVPLSVSIMSLVGPAVVAASGWRVLFLASAAVVLVVAGLVAAVIRDPEPLGPEPVRRAAGLVAEAPAVHLSLYRSRRAFGLGVAFMCFAGLQVGYIALLPTYLVSGLGMGGVDAGLILSVTTPFALAGTVIAGLLQRFRFPEVPAQALAFLGLGASGAAVFLVGDDVVWLTLLGMVLFTTGGVAGSLMFASLPARTSDAAGVALLSGLLVQFGNIGSLTGAPIFASAAEAGGWSAVAVAVGAVAALGFAATIAGR